MKRRSMIVGGSASAGAAVLGNVFIGADAMRWFRGLARPRWQLPMPGLVTIGGAYYLVLGYVLTRSVDRQDRRSSAFALSVLVANEAWNAAFFGRRSTRNGLLGAMGFLVPLGGLQLSVWRDPKSRQALLPYTAFVLLYDLPWIYRLWRLNPGPAR
jgi:tryptophan-rich sensory protein